MKENRDYDAMKIVYSYKSFARLNYFLELGYTEQDWKAAISSLQARGLVTKSGALSPSFKTWRNANMLTGGFSTTREMKKEFFKTELENALQ